MIPWEHVPDKIALTAEQIHVWRFDLAADDALCSTRSHYLSVDEQARVARFLDPIAGRRFLMARSGLRLILSRYLAQSPEAIHFLTTPQGKPYITHDLAFNLSHSDDLALCAVILKHPVGIDVEWIKPRKRFLRIAKRFFSAREYATLKALPEGEQLEGFYLAWTRKEAVIKMLGEGLAYPLSSFDVTLTPEEPAKILRMQHHPDIVASWQINSFVPVANTVAAVVCAQKNLSLTFFSF